MTRPLLPCGTTAAYHRHLRHGEPPCDACRAANRERWADRDRAYRLRRGRPRRELQPCGTPAAARRHWRRGEPLDDACLQASRYGNGRTAQPGVMAEDWREIRNGIPWKPYRYRGLGYDQYEHLYEEAS